MQLYIPPDLVSWQSLKKDSQRELCVPWIFLQMQFLSYTLRLAWLVTFENQPVATEPFWQRSLKELLLATNAKAHALWRKRTRQMHCTSLSAFECAVNSSCGVDSGVLEQDVRTLPENFEPLGLGLESLFAAQTALDLYTVSFSSLWLNPLLLSDPALHRRNKNGTSRDRGFQTRLLMSESLFDHTILNCFKQWKTSTLWTRSPVKNK